MSQNDAWERLLLERNKELKLEWLNVKRWKGLPLEPMHAAVCSHVGQDMLNAFCMVLSIFLLHGTDYREPIDKCVMEVWDQPRSSKRNDD